MPRTITASAQSVLESKGLSYDLVLAATQAKDLRAELAMQTWNVLSSLESVESELRSTGASLTRTIDGVNAHLDAGQHINSLGELQSTGVRYDQACTKRQSLIDQLVAYSYALAKTFDDCIRECGRKALPGEDDCKQCANDAAEFAHADARMGS